jgi:hypothetical protein
MRAPTALEALPSRIWCRAVTAVLAATAATIATWCVTSGDVVSLWMRASVAVASLALAVWILRLLVAAPAGLRWTGAAWELLPAGGCEPVRGNPTVALDFGGWMLLRFVAEGSGHVVWLPAERRGDAAAWHALRTALYSAPGGHR